MPRGGSGATNMIGTNRTWCDVRFESAMRAKADVQASRRYQNRSSRNRVVRFIIPLQRNLKTCPSNGTVTMIELKQKYDASTVEPSCGKR